MILRSVGYAISWEYWRRGTYWIVPACAALVIALMSPVYAVFSIKVDVRVELNHSIFGVVCWAALVMALASRGALRSKYTLPVRSGALVGCTLANGALAAAIIYWLVALSFNTAFHTGWPLWGPAWWAVVTYVAFQTAVWSTAGARGGVLRPIVFLVLLVIFAGLPNLLQRLVPTSSETGGAPVWPTISAAELAASLAAVAACYLAAVYVVARDRCGEAWSPVWLSPAWWTQRVGNSAFLPAAAQSQFTPRTFRSPRAAQFWMEWRSKGRYVPLAVAATLGVLWVVAAVNRLDWRSVSEALEGLTAMFFMIAPFVGVYLGHRSERFDMKPFLATQPLTDGDQAMVVLRHVAAACGAGAIIWLIGVVVTATVWGQPFPSVPPGREAVTLLFKAQLLLGFLLALWTLVAIGAALGMARSWFVPVGGLGGGVLLMIFVHFAGRGSSLPAAVATLLLVGGSVGGTAAAFVAARRKRLISMPTMLRALVAYVVLVLICFFTARDTGGMSLEALPCIVGFCAAPLAPMAAAPLALAWNRHR